MLGAPSHSVPHWVSLRVGLWGALQGVVQQQLLDEVHMRHEHPPAAVPHQPQRIHGVTAVVNKDIAFLCTVHVLLLGCLSRLVNMDQ